MVYSVYSIIVWVWYWDTPDSSKWLASVIFSPFQFKNCCCIRIWDYNWGIRPAHILFVQTNYSNYIICMVLFTSSTVSLNRFRLAMSPVSHRMLRHTEGADTASHDINISKSITFSHVVEHLLEKPVADSVGLGVRKWAQRMSWRDLHRYSYLHVFYIPVHMQVYIMCWWRRESTHYIHIELYIYIYDM